MSSSGERQPPGNDTGEMNERKALELQTKASRGLWRIDKGAARQEERMMLGKVLVTAETFGRSSEPGRFLDSSGCEVISHPADTGLTEGQFVELCHDADALICGLEPVTARVIDNARRLKAIARTGVGYDTVDVTAATRRGIPIGISPGTNDQSVADLTIGLMVAVARRLIDAHESVQAGRWEAIVGVELWKKTLAIVGLGRVGKAVARRARGFDMRVIAVDVFSTTRNSWPSGASSMSVWSRRFRKSISSL